jgi:hypothetical protein
MNGKRDLPAGGLPPADLGAVFGGPEQRRGRLGGILPSGSTTAREPERAENPPESKQTEPDRAPEDGPGEQAPAAATEPELAPAIPEPAADDVDQAATDPDARQLIVYMPERLRARLKRAAVGSTQLYVMLDAVEKTESAGILGRLVRQHQAPDTSGLFARRPARGVEPNVQVNARAMHQHVDVLDRLAAKYDTNRSELIRVALDHELPGGGAQRRRPR